MNRKVLLLAPVLLTVLIAAALGGFVVVQSQRQAEQVERADAVAADYLSAVGVFRSAVLKLTAKADAENPQELREQLVKAIKSPPALPDVQGYGKDGSGAYQSAEAVEAGLLAPYEALSASLKKADVAFDYVKAARNALDLRVTDFIDGTTLSNSAQLRSSLIPAFVQARGILAETKVPPGQDALAATVDGALGYVVTEATTLADRIDANQNYSFTYDAQFNAARKAVEDYATAVSGDLTEQLNAITDL